MIRLRDKMKKMSRHDQTENLRGRGKQRETERIGERRVIAGKGAH